MYWSGDTRDGSDFHFRGEPFRDTLTYQARSAKLVVNRVLTAPCETATLHPTSGGNIHAFTALTPCAVLDVLAPPYSAVTGRHCTYYREAHSVGSNPGGIIANGENRDDQGDTMLEEYLPPDDFVVQRGEYRGPRVGP
ncbi:hypothetical protein Mapa_002252 [Marchantia paleacea]|nr:hypothetical protein Mapa_002252 [Marchantia paleacea]